MQNILHLYLLFPVLFISFLILAFLAFVWSREALLTPSILIEYFQGFIFSLNNSLGHSDDYISNILCVRVL